MAYRIKAREPVDSGLKRVVAEEIASAAAQFTGKGAANRDEAIHEARKSVKRIRGVLRLIEPGLGDTFDQENVRMRNIGRRLSQFRDAAAIIETLDAMKERYREELGRHTLASIRRGLLARKKRGETRRPLPMLLGKIAATLLSVGKRVERWPIGEGFAALAPGLEKTFRRGRRAMARAHRHPGDSNYHEWRKRVKDQWYQIRLLESYWTEEMQGYEKHLKRLEQLLGDAHNVVVLRETVLASPAAFGKEKEVAFFVSLLDRYQKELREGALAVGEHLYQEKTRQYAKRLRQLWEAQAG